VVLVEEVIEEVLKVQVYFNQQIIVKLLLLKMTDMKNQIIQYMVLLYIQINQALIYMQIQILIMVF
jgi:hypothetical protein